MHYSAPEVERIARVAFEAARKRNKRVCSVDKENVLETSRLWREVVTAVGKDYPDVALTHMYVDNAAMQLLKNPRQFDVLVTGNIFGDILSDEASMLAGSIGMLPSARWMRTTRACTSHPWQRAGHHMGQNKATSLATILSDRMMFKYTFNRVDVSDRIDAAVRSVLRAGKRTGDIAMKGEQIIGTKEMGDAVVAVL